MLGLRLERPRDCVREWTSHESVRSSGQSLNSSRQFRVPLGSEYTAVSEKCLEDMTNLQHISEAILLKRQT